MKINQKVNHRISICVACHDVTLCKRYRLDIYGIWILFNAKRMKRIFYSLRTYLSLHIIFYYSSTKRINNNRLSTVSTRWCSTHLSHTFPHINEKSRARRTLRITEVSIEFAFGGPFPFGTGWNAMPQRICIQASSITVIENFMRLKRIRREYFSSNK